MEFALIAYLVTTVLPALLAAAPPLLGAAFVLLTLVALSWMIYVLNAPYNKKDSEVYENKYRGNLTSFSKKASKWGVALILVAGLTQLIPNKENSYIILGAYATDRAVNSEVLQEVGGAIKDRIIAYTKNTESKDVIEDVVTTLDKTTKDATVIDEIVDQTFSDSSE